MAFFVGFCTDFVPILLCYVVCLEVNGDTSGIDMDAGKSFAGILGMADGVEVGDKRQYTGSTSGKVEDRSGVLMRHNNTILRDGWLIFGVYLQSDGGQNTTTNGRYKRECLRLGCLLQVIRGRKHGGVEGDG